MSGALGPRQVQSMATMRQIVRRSGRSTATGTHLVALVLAPFALVTTLVRWAPNDGTVG